MTKTSVIILVALVLVFFSSSTFAQMSFVILPMEYRGDVSVEDKEAAESSLYQNLIASGKYKIIERSRIKHILEEQRFQMTGVTDPAKVVKIGKVLGVEKLITTTIYMKGEFQFTLNISVIDVATAQVEFSREESWVDYSAEDHGRFCAADIIMEYPLMGKVLGKVKDIIIVNLGRAHGLSVGERLFVARKEVLLDDNGEILFQEFNRVGTLEVTRLDAARLQAKTKFLEDPNNSFQKNDLASPEPIPKKEPLISITPLLSNVVSGGLLLQDDMEKRKYLSPTSNRNEDYIKGELHLDATHLNSGQAYCYYPTPFDNLGDFIIEGEVEFQEVEDKYNRFSVEFRSKGERESGSSYSFFWNDEGSFAVYKDMIGNPFPLISLQSSPAINRGESKNKFRVVAYGSRFDCYLNDEFIVGFEDELLEKGKIGLLVDYGGYATIDNIKIWKPKVSGLDL